MNNIRSFTTNICILCIVCLTITNVNAVEKNEDCITPNHETAKCIPITACQPLLEAIRSRRPQAIRFVQASQCGYEATHPHVCCGTYSGYASNPYDDIFDIFSDIPYVRTEEQAKLDLENEILRSVSTTTLADKTVCGLEKTKRNGTQRKEQTDFDEYPWTVILEYRKTDGSGADSVCGGSLINNRYVLTAASCLQQKGLKLTNVQLGEWDLTSDEDCHQVETKVTTSCADASPGIGRVGPSPSSLELGLNSRARPAPELGRRIPTPGCRNQNIESHTTKACAKAKRINVKKIFTHPFYHKDTGNNNIGLIRLETDVSYTDYIRPVCLPSQSSRSPEYDSIMTVTGWGFRENRNPSNIKLQTRVELLSPTACKKIKTVAPYQLCAIANTPASRKSSTSTRNTCLGDIGGAIVKTDEKVLSQGQWYQEGIYSNGCSTDSPFVYTRASRYINWIKSIISKE